MSPIKLEAFGLESFETPAGDQIGDAISRLLDGKSRDELLAMAGGLVSEIAAHDLSEGAPKTREELWRYIKDTWNIEVSDVAVCPDHDPPFEFIWLGYAELVPNLFCIGPRSGGKSFDTALAMELDSRFKPGCESMVFGAVDDQNKKVYEDMVEFFINGGMPDGESEILGQPKITETVYKNGSKVRSYPGTFAKMNGQHPPKARAEEVEIFNARAWPESRNMATDKVINNKRIKAQNFGTSTRKRKNGRVDKIFKKFLKAKQRAIEYLGSDATEEQVRDHVAFTSDWWCVIYCTFEISQQVSNCRTAPENTGRPEEELCRCHLVRNGEWDNREPRTFDQICRGRLYRSRGHRTLRENHQLFLQNDRSTYEAQQLCAEASSEGLYIKSFSRNRHGLSRFALNPANGPVYSGTDWGTAEQSAVIYVQYIERPMTAVGYDGEPVIIKRGDRVYLAEVVEEGKTSGELGQSAIVRERKMASHLSGLHSLPIRKRYADVQGAGDIRLWNKMGLRITKYKNRSFDDHVKEMRGLFDAGRAWVVVDYDSFTGLGCPEFCDQVESWAQDENGNEDRSYPQHVPSAARYVTYGMHRIYNDPGALAVSVEDLVPINDQTHRAIAPAARQHARFTPGGAGDAPQPEPWMAEFGATGFPR